MDLTHDAGFVVDGASTPDLSGRLTKLVRVEDGDCVHMTRQQDRGVAVRGRIGEDIEAGPMRERGGMGVNGLPLNGVIEGLEELLEVDPDGVFFVRGRVDVDEVAVEAEERCLIFVIGRGQLLRPVTCCCQGQALLLTGSRVTCRGGAQSEKA